MRVCVWVCVRKNMCLCLSVNVCVWCQCVREGVCGMCVFGVQASVCVFMWTLVTTLTLCVQAMLEDREERKKREALRETQRKKEEAREAAVQAAKVGDTGLKL